MKLVDGRSQIFQIADVNGYPYWLSEVNLLLPNLETQQPFCLLAGYAGDYREGDM
jgi:hypothetical protein